LRSLPSLRSRPQRLTLTGSAALSGLSLAAISVGTGLGAFGFSHMFVMVLIMTVTPVHMESSGHDLTAVGAVLSAHYVGMFALAPIAGLFADRFGKPRAIWTGFAILVLAALSVAVVPAQSGFTLAVPLFMVGLGWSFAFVSASALLTEGMSYADRARVQGSADTAVCTFSAAASVASGLLLAAYGYSTLNLAAGALAAATALMLAGRPRPADKLSSPP
ncbi:MAG: MFS transporter, partial [Actinomycetota bacterium]|nr:MFS transporter [Actinomycetota bacterium]